VTVEAEVKRNYTVFPITLIEETIDELRARGARFIVPGELGALASAARTRVDYLREYAHWQTGHHRGVRFWLWCAKRLAARRLARLVRVAPERVAPDGTPEVFLHHDADRNPENTVAVMEREARKGAVSAAYFFRTRAARWPGDDEPYDVDRGRLKALERCGFEIGYHLNAPELADYDAVKGARLIEEDVAYFAEHFNLRSFVPHGGRRGPNGVNNHHIAHEGCLDGLVWFYNGRGLLTDISWSDGHLEAPESESLPDPRMVARRVGRRTRARFLFHPQYYGDQLRENLDEVGVTRTQWWRDLWH